nr:MAG TPA: hypothetical protein [Caudoviricetes sp.]
MLPVETTTEQLRKRRPTQLIFDFESVVKEKCKQRYKYDDFEEYQKLDDLSERIIMVINEYVSKGGEL